MASKNPSLEFLSAFCDADLERLETLLVEDLVFEGPLFRFDSRAAYLDGLRSSGLERASFEVLRSIRGDEQEALLWEYRKARGSLRISQWSRIRGGKIAEIVLVFDASGFR
ncbi:MAG: nuclear transport factor 2 family protein [Holophagales bacterium]|nr:nuclear transport factor 2 family protein [Holophagales bacterium]